jgi:hypothetical protein
VASNYPAEGRSASEGGDEPPQLPFRPGGSDHPKHIEARAELRDRETYYAELRLAVHCQSRSQLDDRRPDTWTRAVDQVRTEDEAWDELVARFGDTWT